MKFNPDELALARAYTASLQFEGLSDEQMRKIMARGRDLFHWYNERRFAHAMISTAVLVFLFGTDYLVQVTLPAQLLGDVSTSSTAMRVVAAAVVVGVLHGWLLYSLGAYSIHEGASHKAIYPPNGPITRALHWFSANLTRIGGSEPNQYATHHMIHHSKFGSEEDPEFLNFVKPRRFWPVLLPLAFEFNYTNFISHRPLGMTRDRLMSLFWSLPYHGLYLWYAWTHFGPLYAILYALLGAHIGFMFDRVRAFSEHNLMPLDNKNGARSFGLGFWGMLIGGGPWGAPCHWEHHLVPSLPWYQQLILHRYAVGLLTPAQRRQFLIEPVVGFPKLFWRLVRDLNRFQARRSGTHASTT